MTKIKNMQNFFMVLGLVAAILVAISAFGYNYYSNLSVEGSEKKAQKERINIQDKISEGNKNLNNKFNNQDSLLTDIKHGQSEIKNEIKSSTQKNKPGINVQNSPNAVIQYNENGDNVINNPELPKPVASLNQWAIKNKKVNQIIRRYKPITLPTDKIPYDSLYHNQILVRYSSEVARSEAVFLLKREDVIHSDILINGMINFRSGMSNYGYVIILSNPQNGVYKIDYYTKEQIDITTEFNFVK